MALARGAATFKCSQCRAAKQRCTPAQRVWIESQKGPKCDLCRQHQRECGPPEPPAIRTVKANVTERSGSDLEVSTSLRSNERAVLRCMHVLTEIIWDDLGYPNFNKSGNSPGELVPQWKQAIVYGYVYGKYETANLVLYHLWERQEYIRIYNDFVSFVEQRQDNVSAAESERMFKEKLAESVPSQKPGEPHDSDMSTEEDVRIAVEAILRRGARWHALVLGVNSKEIFLLDQTKYFGDSDVTIGEVIENGTDEEFEEVKHFLLEPENGLQDNCYRLTGLSAMIRELASASKGTDVRRYLLRKVKERIEMEFGPPINLPENATFSEIDFFFGKPQRDIMCLFGFQVHVKFDVDGDGDGDVGEPDLQDKLPDQTVYRHGVRVQTSDAPNDVASLS